MSVRVLHADMLEAIPRLVAEGVVCDADTRFLDDGGIFYGVVANRGGDGQRDRLGRLIPGKAWVGLICGHCGSPIERELSQIRHLVTKRGVKSFYCGRACKNSAESIAQTPPPLAIPAHLRQPIATTSEIELGKAAEHLVCADLILLGYRAYLSDQGLPYDVVVDAAGRLIRVQVKGTAKTKAIPQRAAHTPAYYWNPKRAGRAGKRRYGANEFDMVALVAVDIRCVAYLSVSGLIRQTITLRPPGTPISHKNKRLKNIDEYLFSAALSEVLK